MAKNATTNTKSPARNMSGEQFDLNLVCVTGPVIGVWGRNGDVFVRLQSPNLLPLSSPPSFVNVCIPNGMLDGVPVTLQKGDLLRVTGYVRQTKFSESIRKILTEAGKPEFIEENVPADDVKAWRKIRLSRRNAMMQAVAIESLKEGHAQENSIDLEGIITEVWTYKRDEGEDLFVRVAAYDANTIETDQEGNFGRKKRIPHYINVLFPLGRPLSAPDDKKMFFRAKQRIRVRGELRNKWNTETLHQLLFSTGKPEIIGLLQRVNNADELHQMKTQLETLHVLANAVILYSR